MASSLSASPGSLVPTAHHTTTPPTPTAGTPAAQGAGATAAAAGPTLALVPLTAATAVLPVPGPGGAGAVARVMSPSGSRSLNEGILHGVHATCQVCTQAIYEPAVCAMCGKFGHPICLGMERFADYPFCAACVPRAIAQYAAANDAQHRDQWRRELAEQIATWKSRALTAAGIGSSLGLAVGSVVATAAGAAAGLARGALAGATAVTSTARPALADAAGSNAAVPEPWRPRLRRSRSQDLSDDAHCIACWTTNTSHKAHTYRGDCAVMPGRALWSKPALAAASPAAPTPLPSLQPLPAPAQAEEPPLRLEFGPDRGSLEDRVRLFGSRAVQESATTQAFCMLPRMATHLESCQARLKPRPSCQRPPGAPG